MTALPNISDLTATQRAAILAADEHGIIPLHFPRVTIRALFMRHLAVRVNQLQPSVTPARLTADGRSIRAELEGKAPR